MKFSDIRERCPFHPKEKPLLYDVETSTNKCVEHYICGKIGCEHEWTRDLTDVMKGEYRG